MYGMTLEDDGMDNDPTVNFRFATFENIWLSLFSVFQTITFDGWTSHMYSAMNCSQPVVAVVFFVFLIVFGNFILLDLVLVVIIESFTKYTSEDEITVEQLMAIIKLVIAKKFN